MAKVFSSNADLFAYLGRLRQMLADRGADDLAGVVGKAMRFASGMSAEFLGESRIALRAVSQARDSPLDQSERQFLAEAVADLDAALGRR